MNKTSEHLNELFGALSKAQGQIKGAVKDGKNPHFKSQFATLDACWNACREPLTSNGLTIVQTVEETDGKLSLRTILGHSSGQYISSSMPLLLAKQDPQSLGSACSYMRRYSLAAIVGLTQSDDDGESAMDGHREVSIFDFVMTISKIGKQVVDVSELEKFINELSQAQRKPTGQIMEEALKPGQTKLFIEAFVGWKSTHSTR